MRDTTEIVFLGGTSTEERRCHNRKGLQKSVDVFRRLSLGITICIFLFISRPALHNQRKILAHLAKRLVIRIFIKQANRE